MEQTRRGFVTTIMKSLLVASSAGALTTLVLPGADAQVKPEVVSDYDWDKFYWGYGIDIDKCIGCGRCVQACKTENNVPDLPFYFRTWVERYAEYGDGKTFIESPNGGKDGFPDLTEAKKVNLSKTFFVPKICNQCEEPSCVKVCPVSATYKSKDGVVLIDHSICVGCRYCIQACPYGARYYSQKYQYAEKCTLCYHRITRGLLPACVQNCPVQARIFGNLKDPNSPISKFIRENNIQVLKPHLGTKPKAYYHNLDKEVS